jgi:Tol biopolymer transport system component
LVYIEGAREDSQKWLAVVDADGNNRHRLLEITEMNIQGLSISQDGKTVLLAREERRVIQIPHQGHIDLETKYPDNILKIDIATGTVVPLTDFNDIRASYPVYSPNGKQIAFMGRTDDPQTHFDIYVMNADGTNVRRMTQHNGEMFYPGSVLHWSPDSRKVLYDLITVWVDDSTAYLDIFVLDVATSKEVNLTNTDNISENEPRWSPNGKKIAFMSSAGVEYPNYIYVMDADGHNLKEVAARLGQPSWLPDNRRLVAAGRWEDGTIAMVTVDAESGKIKKLVPYRLIVDNYSGMQYPVWLGK